jgi:two-component system, OmpR family, response regulator MprA
MDLPEKILVVDDDPTVRRAFSRALTSMGYGVSECEDGLEVLERIQAGEPSLIILDVDMPRMDGWKTLAELRRRGWKQPVLMVTHVDDVDSRVRGLDSGADDYISKPCNASELLARVRALLRRAAPVRTATTTLRFGNVLVDLARKTATCGTEEFRLTRSEYALLTCLLENIGTPVSREVIFERVWGGKAGNSHTLDTHLWRLRKKLGDTCDNPHWICNHAGVGYSMAVEVANAQ